MTSLCSSIITATTQLEETQITDFEKNLNTLKGLWTPTSERITTIQVGGGKIFFQWECPNWHKEKASPKHQDLQVYTKELCKFMETVNQFNISINLQTKLPTCGPVVRNGMCSRFKVHPTGLKAIFKSS